MEMGLTFYIPNYFSYVFILVIEKVLISTNYTPLIKFNAL